MFPNCCSVQHLTNSAKQMNCSPGKIEEKCRLIRHRPPQKPANKCRNTRTKPFPTANLNCCSEQANRNLEVLTNWNLKLFPGKSQQLAQTQDTPHKKTLGSLRLLSRKTPSRSAKNRRKKFLAQQKMNCHRKQNSLLPNRLPASLPMRRNTASRLPSLG